MNKHRNKERRFSFAEIVVLILKQLSSRWLQVTALGSRTATWEVMRDADQAEQRISTMRMRSTACK
jgi:hypothetical protein